MVGGVDFVLLVPSCLASLEKIFPSTKKKSSLTFLLLQEIFAGAEGLISVMRCLSTKPYRSKGAALLRELSKSAFIREKIPDILGAILSLVTLYIHYESDSDVGVNLRFVLEKLSENDKNVVAMAKANWSHPLIKRLASGLSYSHLLLCSFAFLRAAAKSLYPVRCGHVLSWL